MQKNLAGRLDGASRVAPYADATDEPQDALASHPGDGDRADRRGTQKLVLLGISIVAVFALAGMIITRAMEIASL
ncbi:hypothetical protein [Alloyangia pacifica]|uniref:hypothetical protein n=1 Tax=Alloyangia pacifica TaxID=311180 RepID=UPI001CFF125C|nr:hypothetical protein [Alloyangia pacifica]